MDKKESSRGKGINIAGDLEVVNHQTPILLMLPSLQHSMLYQVCTVHTAITEKNTNDKGRI